jgi:HAD superfamily hydrolase (TIGR01450 family)
MLALAYDLLILDLDGVVYVGEEPVPHAIETLNQLSGHVEICAATNNAARPPETVANHLNSLGLNISADRVFTSAQAAARMLGQHIPRGSTVLAVGGSGVNQALEAAGFKVIRATRDTHENLRSLEQISAVVQGHGPDNSWWDYQLAMIAIQNGALWVATNRDSTVPTSIGIGPGNGSFVRMIAELTGREPLVAGKPEPALFREAMLKTGAKRPLVIGDRYDTDIDGAANLGVDSMLVLTGVHQAENMGDNPATYIAPDLRVLLAN